MNKRLTYSIQQVADMTGLSKQVIRKWEDRYGIITPERMENGYRIYNQAEVSLLQKIVALTEAGHSVKQAAMLVQQEPEEQEEVIEESVDRSGYFLYALEDAGKLADDNKILHLLEQAHHQFGIEISIQKSFFPSYKESVSSGVIKNGESTRKRSAAKRFVTFGKRSPPLLCSRQCSTYCRQLSAK